MKIVALTRVVLGVYDRVPSWPLGYKPSALAAAPWIMANEETFLAMQARLAWRLVPRLCVPAEAYAFPACRAPYSAGMAWVAHRLIAFVRMPSVIRTLFVYAALVGAALAPNLLLAGLPTLAIAALIVGARTLWTPRGWRPASAPDIGWCIGCGACP